MERRRSGTAAARVGNGGGQLSRAVESELVSPEQSTWSKKRSESGISPVSDLGTSAAGVVAAGTIRALGKRIQMPS